MVDASEGIIGIEWIDGQSVRHLLPGGAEEEDDTEEVSEYEEEETDSLLNYGLTQGMHDQSMHSIL